MFPYVSILLGKRAEGWIYSWAIAEETLDKIHITVNKNTIPNDDEPPTKTSGIRLGTPAMTTRGFKEEDFIKVGKIISKSLKNIDNQKIQKELSKEVLELTKKYKFL